MKPRVLIDVTRSPHTGIGSYSWNLLEHLGRTNDMYKFIGLTFPCNQQYADLRCIETALIDKNPTNTCEVEELSNLIDRTANVYIATNFTQISFPSIPIIQVVHDMLYLLNLSWQPTEHDLEVRHGKQMIEYIKQIYLPLLKRKLSSQHGRWKNLIGESMVSELFVYAQSHAILRAVTLIAVSNNTKSALLKHYKIDKPLEVVYPIVNLQPIHPIDTPNTRGELIILYIANFEPRKNHKIVFQTLEALPEGIRRRVKLVLIGQPLYQSHRIQFEYALNEFNNRINIEVYTDISEEEKVLWIRRSTLLLYQSLDEGFGIPLLEAMMYHLPIICLDTPIYREVCGEGAIYVKENNPESFAREVKAIIQNPAITARLIAHQNNQIQKFDRSHVNEKINILIEQALKQSVREYRR
ncbi:MAG: glycosyltransferase [Nitrospirae bacterium]|nr:glycosyltransferase [Nitrospirota bacterium]